MTLLRTILKSSLLSWIIVSEVALLIIAVNNPKFIDSLGGLVLFFIILPLVMGLLWSIIQTLFIVIGNRFRKTSFDPKSSAAVTLSMVLAIGLAAYLFLWLISNQLTTSSSRFMYLLFLAVAHIIGIALYKLFKKLFALILTKKQTLGLAFIVLVLAITVAAVSILPSFVGSKAIQGEDKVLILGYDGTSWNVLEDMFKKKEMPHFQKLMKSGSYGNLRSLMPLYSPLIWNTIASGKSYEKHGVLSFATPSYDVKCSRIWDILEIQGKSIGLCGYYQTWPPWETNGFIIPEHLASGPEAYPPGLSFIRELYRGAKFQKLSPLKMLQYGFLSVQNGLRLSTLKLIATNVVSARITSSKQFELDTYHKKRILSLRIYGDLFSHLTKKYSPDLAVFMNKVPDNVSHQYWKFLEPEGYDDVTEEQIEKYSGVIYESYREVDKTMGRILENYGDETTIFLVSDHGFQSVYEKNMGTNPKKQYYISSTKLLELLGIKDKVEALHSADKVNIRILTEYHAETEQILTLLNSVIFEESGDQVFDVTEILPSFYQLRVPRGYEDHTSKVIRINNNLIKFAEISDDDYRKQVSGTHDINGVIVMRSPHIKKDHKIFEASILDVTPTILYLLNIPVGEDMDGKVLDEAIADSYLTAHKVEFIPSHDTNRKARVGKLKKGMSEKLKEELKALGYIR